MWSTSVQVSFWLKALLRDLLLDLQWTNESYSVSIGYPEEKVLEILAKCTQGCHFVAVPFLMLIPYWSEWWSIDVINMTSHQRVANGKTNMVFSWRNCSPVRCCPLQLHKAFSSTFEAWPYSASSYSIQCTFRLRQKSVIGGGTLCDSCHVNTLFCVQCWVSLPSCLCIFLFSRSKLFFVDEVVYIAGNSDTTAFVLSLRK